MERRCVNETSKPELPVRARGIHARWFVVAVVIAASFLFIGARGLWEPDEGRYVTVGLQMLRTGDWINPQLHHEQPHMTKPPLTYWLIASGVSLLGRNELATRLPGAISLAVLAGCAAAMARRVAKGNVGASAVMMATSALPFFASNIVTTDTLLAAMEGVAMTGFVLAWRRLDSPQPHSPHGEVTTGAFHRGWLWLMWVGFGLAFLTKGPPGLLPLMAVIAVVAWHDRWRGLFQLFFTPGLLVGLAIGLWWFAVILIRNPDMMNYFLRHEVVGRVMTDEHGRNPEWYMAFMYIPILIGGLLPWAVEWWPNPQRPPYAGGIRSAFGSPELRLLILWVLLPLIVFMLARSRLPLYVVPLMLPLVLLTARRVPADWIRWRQTQAAILIVVVGLLGVRFWLGHSSLGRDSREVARKIDVPADLREVVFVGSRAWYGLSLYLDTEIETMPVEELADELAEREGTVLMVMPEEHAEDLLTLVQQSGWSVESPQVIDERMAFVARPPSKGDKRPNMATSSHAGDHGENQAND